MATITPGTRLGPYEILAHLGAGGMGEVWRARDTRLDREVAIKVLPAALADDQERLQRFEQEARATSALNHPNILTVFDIGTHEGSPYIVAELLEGHELRAHLKDGAISARKAVEYAAQIASGLAAAHEKRIVHRDLKPENLFVNTDGRIKILDFGLAKLRPPQSEPSGSDVTTKRAITVPGVVMGTVGYMSPEQTRGQDADHRADIFSLGAILYEMLSGKQAFGGETAIEVMNAILKDEPNELSETTTKVNPALEKIVRRCLEKKPERRFQTASDLGFALDALSFPSASQSEHALSGTPVIARRRLFGDARLAWLVAVLLLTTLGLTWLYVAHKDATDVRVMRFSILPPEKASFGNIAVSPDGKWLAFTASTGGTAQLWVRRIESLEGRPLPGTAGARFPFWSPNSSYIGFFADGRLKKIEASSGLAQTLCEASNGLGGTWSHDGVILFARTGAGLSRISATGGEVTEVTTPDRTRQENYHWAPAFLPDGRHFLYCIRSGQKETRGVYLGSLEGAVKQRLLGDVTSARYTAATPESPAAGGDGWLLFGRDGALMAQPFDARRLQFSGEPFRISEHVGSDLIYAGYFIFSASANGVLVFDPSVNRQRRRYLWMDRGGQTGSLDVVGSTAQPWLSPDEKHFLADRTDPQTGTFDLWLCDVGDGSAARFTFDPASDLAPVWSPDGKRIVWASAREGALNLYQKAASGAGQDTLLLESGYNKVPSDWSRDGRFILYHETNPKTKNDVWVLPVAESVAAPGGASSGEPKPFPFLQTEADEFGATMSPNGRWVAYVSDESGRYEVYVQSFPGGGGTRQVSTGGGTAPRWRRDGQELFYYASDGKMMAALVQSGENFAASAAAPLFEFRVGNANPFFAPYAVTGDGQRFLLNATVETEMAWPLTVVINWTAEVRR
jgi:serine/threonine protein kinase/Tol biopolymer transport system component